jgi:hypothetical protein
MKPCSALFMSTLLLAAAAAVADDTKIDVASLDPAVAPVIRASTDTVIDYPGGTAPGNVPGSFDAQDSTFNRPTSCSSLSGVGTAVPFDTITLTNSGANTATVNVRLGQAGDPAVACGTVIDPFMILYNGSFNPASALTNCLLVNDDTNGGTDRCPSLTGVSVPSGQTRVIVLTTFDNADFFPYEVTFAGTTPVTLQSYEVE